MTMKKSATPTVQASGVFHRMSGVWRRAGSFLPVRRLTFVVLLLAAAAFGGVFAVAQAQEAEGAISGLTLSSDSPGTLTVSWDTPSPAPSDYRLRWAPAESDYLSWKDDNETDRGNEYPAGDATSLTLSGLSEETEYKVQVRARYNDGDAPWSGSWASSSLRVSGDAQEEEATPTPEPTATPEPTPVPGAINGLTLGSETPGTLTVSWDAPSPQPTDYRLRWAPVGSDYLPWSDDDETDRGNAYPGGGATSLTLSGLSEGTEYKVQVRARYNDGAHKDKPWSGPWTEEVRGQPSEESAGSGVKGATDDPSAPAAPNLSGAAVTPEGHVLLAWLDPSDDSITGYQVLRGPDADNLVVIEEDTGSNGTSYTDTSPPPGRTHTYAVKARNAAGLSPPSGTVTATVPEAEEEEEELITSQQNSDATLVSNLRQTNGSNFATGTIGRQASTVFCRRPGPRRLRLPHPGHPGLCSCGHFWYEDHYSASARQPARGRKRAPRTPSAHPDRAGRLRQHPITGSTRSQPHRARFFAAEPSTGSYSRVVTGILEFCLLPQDHELPRRGPGPAAGRTAGSSVTTRSFPLAATMCGVRNRGSSSWRCWASPSGIPPSPPANRRTATCPRTPPPGGSWSSTAPA